MSKLGTMNDAGKDENIESQMQKLRQGAEFHAARARKAREDFERFIRDTTTNTYQLEEGTPAYQSLKIALETAFTFGQISGESAETNLVLGEQLALMRDMIETSKKRDAERAAHDRAQAERETFALKLQERQVLAIEKLAGASKEAKGPKKASVRSSARRTRTRG